MTKIFLINSYTGGITLLEDPLFVKRLGELLNAEISSFGNGTDREYNLRKRSPLYNNPTNIEFEKCTLADYVSTFVMSRSRLFNFKNRTVKDDHNLDNPFLLRSQSMAFLHYAIDILKNEKPQVILHARIPHTGLDLSFWYAAKHLNIPSLFAWQSRRTYHFMLWDELSVCTNFDKLASLRAIEKIEIERTAKQDWFYMKKKPQKVLDKLRSRSFQSILLQGFRRLRQASSEACSIEYLAYARRRHHYKKQYLKNFSSVVSDLNEVNNPFIYFPLHLEPEASTLPRAGLYADQLYGLEQLHAKCPSGWKIYVKENPKQTFFCRDEYFFSRLSAMENVVLLPQNYPTSKLIEKSKLVATICGTAGWEAISSGKPAIYFASPWYQDLTGAFRFDDKVCIETISKFEIDHSLLESQISSMESKMPRGLFFRRNVELPKDEEQNREDCAIGIAQFLNKNNFV
ncbi:capsular biosynthesis protein [Mariniblastus sp.]|nr:capsular biosynthesis protein [Mariniblastus sp.]